MAKTTTTRPVRKKKFKSPLLGRFSGWATWFQYTTAFEVYAREPETNAIEPIRVSGWLTQPNSAEPDDSVIRRLYVLDPEDLAEFSLDELLLAWQHRRETCGSLAAAAELMALYRAATGEDELYRGASHYLSHPEVLAVFEPLPDPCPPSHSNLDVASAIESASDPTPLLSLADVRGLSAAHLMQAWEGRPDTFASLEAAAETLASLRWLSSDNAEKTSFQHFLNHALIQDLEDQLPRELDVSPVAVSAEREIELLTEDRRVVRAQLTVVRTGQRDFRTLLWERYGGACCVTGCTIERLVEAAHIVPYRGNQTDGEDNGLLLRVDIHRLFDEHLVAIDPDRLIFVVSKSITDPTYQSLHGISMFRLSRKPRKIFLEAHYRRFLRSENQRPCQ
ncbi:HNH endonuclease signature motif containing protein [Pseudomonas sp. CW003PS]|nr:HNH endonuclease signature motif containing protein [Pseudomonas sp. CW003PS]